VDVYAAFQEHGSRAGQSMDDLLLDGMHPNNAGHALVTERLCVTIDRLALPATPYGALAISP
jgi:lysophospholipase L1-like esterase